MELPLISYTMKTPRRPAQPAQDAPADDNENFKDAEDDGFENAEAATTRWGGERVW